MSKNSYFLTIGRFSVDGQEHIGYGIGCHQENTNIIIEDITLERNAMTELIDRCNALHLSTIHLYDVIEDFLVDQTI